MSIRLYTYRESGNSYKVRLLLAFLGLTVEEVEIDFPGREQHGPAFLAINPRGEVPVLIDGDRTFTDSAAILVHLADKHAGQTWWSHEAAEQAEIVDWLAFAASWIQHGVFTARAILSFQGPHDGFGIWGNANTLAEATARGVKSLQILEAALETRAWLAAGRPTIADLAVFPYVALAPMGDISLEPFPAVRAWIARLRARPGFIPIAGLDDPLYRRRPREAA
ncbi:glutathione S-transferase family protein [Methylobacterium organophilum]|uniref:Disulfide-bond oxidoreductase YfcG n=1 Tax=Methylobacterium organophilum TaxID=410 RepID=A0ABQ4T611_METOR|nr:glutathione S-transferase family protein [Methylobacterium organophilum]GJE25686.1 Disulfide-bond oxidoreductase YfcG [Methylobacterium organophilum]